MALTHLGSSFPPASADRPLEAGAGRPATAEDTPMRCRCALLAERLLVSTPGDSTSLRAIMAAPRCWRMDQLPFKTLDATVRSCKGRGKGSGRLRPAPGQQEKKKKKKGHQRVDRKVGGSGGGNPGPILHLPIQLNSVSFFLCPSALPSRARCLRPVLPERRRRWTGLPLRQPRRTATSTLSMR